MKIVGLLPVGEETTLYVEGAQVAENCDEDGCTFRVELITSRGYVPMTSFYSSGRNAKRKMVAEINTYVAAGEGETLEVVDRGGLWAGLVAIPFIAVGLLLMVAVLRSFVNSR